MTVRTESPLPHTVLAIHHVRVIAFLRSHGIRVVPILFQRWVSPPHKHHSCTIGYDLAVWL